MDIGEILWIRGLTCFEAHIRARMVKNRYQRLHNIREPDRDRLRKMCNTPQGLWRNNAVEDYVKLVGLKRLA